MGRIYIELQGGFGNQLFQAALGVALTKRIGAEVAYLADSFAADTFGRALLLNRFPDLPLPLAPRSAIKGLPVIEGQPAPPGASQGGEGERLLAAIEGKPAAFLSGWWQQESFFLGEHAAIRQAFALRTEPRLTELGERLRAADFIGVHVRRAEYGHFGLVKAAYYREAIAAIRAELGHRPVMFFTDEPNVCMSLFGNVPDMRLYRGDPGNPLPDFYLLGRCGHFVIANSSFSWWAAWLGRRPESIIYAPEPWSLYPLRGPAPPDWRRIPDAINAP